MRPRGEILLGEGLIRERVAEMARAIAADTPAGATISALVVMDGAFVFAADLLRGLPMPVRTALAPVRSVARGGDPRSLALPEDFPVAGSDLLVVEDILDSGRTLSALRAHLESLGPARIRFAVLLDKPARREILFRPDYVGFEVPDAWLVGYGLDWEGLYRNLPYLTCMDRAS